MNEHTWTDTLSEREFTATNFVITWDETVGRQYLPFDFGTFPGSAVTREILRLAQREADLLAELETVEGLKSEARGERDALAQRVQELEDAHREAIGLEAMAYHTNQAAMAIARRRIAVLERAEADALALATERGKRLVELETERADLISERDGWKRTAEYRDAKIAGLERQLSRETVEGALAREEARELQRLLTERGHKLALKNAQIAQLQEVHREDAAVFCRTVKQLEAHQADNRAKCLELAEKAGQIRQLEQEGENLARSLQDQRAANRSLQEQLAGAVMENQGLKMAAEEAGEIEAELVTALALGHGEDLASCKAPCPGHLGPKASAAVDRAAKAWRELEKLAAERLDFISSFHPQAVAAGEENERLRAEVERMAQDRREGNARRLAEMGENHRLREENERLNAEVERLARDGQDAEEESGERIGRMEAAIEGGLAGVEEARRLLVFHGDSQSATVQLDRAHEVLVNAVAVTGTDLDAQQRFMDTAARAGEGDAGASRQLSQAREEFLAESSVHIRAAGSAKLAAPLPCSVAPPGWNPATAPCDGFTPAQMAVIERLDILLADHADRLKAAERRAEGLDLRVRDLHKRLVALEAGKE